MRCAPSGNFVVRQCAGAAVRRRLGRVRDGELSTTDGPFAETKEHLSGFIIIEARDLNEAIRLAGTIPMARLGTIEVRPVQRARAQWTSAIDGTRRGSGDSVAGRLEAVYRSHSRRVLATLIRLLGDFERAEEGLHDAFVAAAAQWPRDGVPANPFAWLVSAGRFKAIDRLRQQGALRRLAEGYGHAVRSRSRRARRCWTTRPSRTISSG